MADLQNIGVDPFDSSGNYVFADPLSASFGGVAGGNRNLTEETADTTTYWLVDQPNFLEGLSSLSTIGKLRSKMQFLLFLLRTLSTVVIKKLR